MHCRSSTPLHCLHAAIFVTFDVQYISLYQRIKISNRRATQRCNVSAFFYAKICSLLARRRSSQPVQRVYWPENVIDWLGKWRPTCVMRHARGQKLQSFRRKWPFYMNLYSMLYTIINIKIYTSHASQRWPRVNNAVGERIMINALYKSKNTCRRIVEMYFIIYFIQWKFINTDIWAT